jgi:polyhydroxyalkanoate synthesis regulator phasin
VLDPIELGKKTLLTGIGLALQTRDEVENLAKDLIEKGKMGKQEGSKFLDELLKKYDETRGALEDRVEKTVRDFLKKADVVTGDDLKAIKKEIRAIKKAINKDKEPT